MTKLTFATHPYMLGFERLDQLVERSVKNANDSYPPYNIEVIGDNEYRITLALAGFREEDLDITLDANQLTVTGKQPETEEEKVFLHRGIAARQFQRSFVLADGVKVANASTENGLLHIVLEREVPQSITKSIPINKS